MSAPGTKVLRPLLARTGALPLSGRRPALGPSGRPAGVRGGMPGEGVELAGGGQMRRRPCDRAVAAAARCQFLSAAVRRIAGGAEGAGWR